jgi:hypothetical protein
VEVKAMKAGILTIILLCLTATQGLSDIEPCNPSAGYPCSDRCVSTPPPGWGLQISIHTGGLECFEFYKQECEEDWVLIYEGSDGSICDCNYNPGIWQRYRVKRFFDVDDETCENFYDECTTYWWGTSARA